MADTSFGITVVMALIDAPDGPKLMVDAVNEDIRLYSHDIAQSGIL